MAFPSPTEFPANPFAKMFEGGPFDLTQPFEFKSFDSKAFELKGLEASAMMRVPVGAASPLWGLFIGAAATGAAFWWMSQWARPQNLEAVFGSAAARPKLLEIAPSAVIEAVAESVLELAEPAEAMVERVVESAVEVVEALAEPVIEAVEAVPVVAEQVIEAEAEAAEQVIEAASVVAEAVVEAVEPAPVIKAVAEIAETVAEPVIEAAPEMIKPVADVAEVVESVAEAAPEAAAETAGAVEAAVAAELPDLPVDDLPVGGEAAPVSVLAEAGKPKASRVRKAPADEPKLD